MYRPFYDLQEKPFQITTDSRFLWLGEKHKEAFATLKYGVLDDKGFLLLTGDVGTGKTTLINALVKSLGSQVLFARIPDPKLEVMDFYRYIASAFAIAKSFQTKGEFLLLFTDFLERAHEAGKQVLLIADEAQRLSDELLEEVRHLSNIEKEHAKLLNIFFVGQSEFNNMLLERKNRAIRQRITVHYRLGPLTEPETGSYIRHRLKVAGAKREIFTNDAVREVFHFSHGAPRLINIICDRALLTGFVAGSAAIGAAAIRECAAELRITPFLDEDERKMEPAPQLVAVKQAAAVAAQPPPLVAASQPLEPPARPQKAEAEHSLPLGASGAKRGSRVGIFFVYLLLLLLIGGLCVFFFDLPLDFLPKNLNSLLMGSS